MSEAGSIEDMYRCSPRELKTFLIDCISAGLVPMIHGKPGVGKSSIVHSVAKEFNLHLIDERLSTRSPVDLAGIPDFQNQGQDRRATFTPFDVFPLEGQPLPKGKDGWVLFLDEFNSAQKSTQAAAYKLILDRMVGLQKLHPNTAIVCAGNLATDRAIVTPLSTAMQSRLVHLELEVNFQEWLDDVAIAQNYDSRIIAYLSYNSDALMDFDPRHNDRTFCCPRTWEFMNRLVKGRPIEERKKKLYGGTITSGVAASFVTFCSVENKLPKLGEILAHPESAPLPMESPARWLTISHLVEKTTSENFGDIATYVNRFTTEFRVLFFRSLLVRQPKMRSHPTFLQALSEISRYIHGGETHARAA